MRQTKKKKKKAEVEEFQNLIHNKHTLYILNSQFSFFKFKTYESNISAKFSIVTFGKPLSNCQVYNNYTYSMTLHWTK